VKRTTFKERQQAAYMRTLEAALAEDAAQYGQHLIEFAVAQARLDGGVLRAIMSKILPDLKAVEYTGEQESPICLTIELPRPQGILPATEEDELFDSGLPVLPPARISIPVAVVEHPKRGRPKKVDKCPNQ